MMIFLAIDCCTFYSSSRVIIIIIVLLYCIPTTPNNRGKKPGVPKKSSLDWSLCVSSLPLCVFTPITAALRIIIILQ